MRIRVFLFASHTAGLLLGLLVGTTTENPSVERFQSLATESGELMNLQIQLLEKRLRFLRLRCTVTIGYRNPHLENYWIHITGSVFIVEEI